ncbi:MAG TPA: glucosyltransferase domain-containing protein [Pyrinomonadaceae bacterium]|jgi:hypothetical protein
MKRWVGILAILTFVGLLYARIPNTYFCGYDDFNENNRAAFEEKKEPLRLLTATHFNSYKYRPLSHTLHYATYWLGNGNPMLFRIRNVGCHLLNVLLIYGIGMLLLDDKLTSSAGALLFGVHPLANQPIVAASFTIPAAHLAFLFALFAFLYSLKKSPGNLVWLGLGLISAWLSLLTYESSISVFALMFGYLILRFLILRERNVNRSYLIVLTMGSLLLIGSYFGLRRLFVTVAAKQAVPSLKTLVTSSAMYTGALLSPIDSVLANSWLGTPLPSELNLHGITMAWRVGLVGLGLVSVVLLVFVVRTLRRKLDRPLLTVQLFLFSAVVLSVLPLIVFTPKPSETYIYLSVAFGALLFSSILGVLFDSRNPLERRIFTVIVVLLTVSFSCATWVRNGRVANCGVTAERIISQLKEDRLKQGTWNVWLAAAPGEPRGQRYGIYGCRGIDTIGEPGMESALRVTNGNEMLTARVTDAALIYSACEGPNALCLVVHDDGRVDELNKSSPVK